MSAEDLRHLKEIVSDFGIGFTMLPDYSETLDGESWTDYQKLSAGGTPIQSIRRMGRALATIQLGRGLGSVADAQPHIWKKHTASGR